MVQRISHPDKRLWRRHLFISYIKYTVLVHIILMKKILTAIVTFICSAVSLILPHSPAVELSSAELSSAKAESVSFCAAAHDENDDADKTENKDFIKWVDFKVPYEVLKAAYSLDCRARAEGDPQFGFIDSLAYLACKNGNSFESKRDVKRLNELFAALKKNGGSVKDALGESKYYKYYTDCYAAVFGGSFGERSDGSYGLTSYFPLASGHWFSHYDDFGNARSYGFKRRHLGHDIMGSVGAPIVAVEGGEIVECGWNRYGGWRVGIRSADKKRYYYYAHLRKDKPYFEGIEKGVTVAAGQPIGYLGVTGYSAKENVNMKTKPHLHIGLQLIFDESQVDGNGEIWIDLYSLTRFWQNCGQHASV